MQIAEFQLLGTLPAVAPGLAQQPPAADVLLAGATLNASVVANGAGPFRYQWFFDTATQIPNATNATLTLANVQATNAGSYNCVISNAYNFTNSTTLVLTVVAATPYEALVLADQPLAFYPLNETSGATAYDVVGGYDGGYSNTPTLDVPGPSTFIPAGAGFDGGTQFVLVPETPALDFGGQITMEAWVQPGTQSGDDADILAKGYDSAQNDDELEIRVNDFTNFHGGFYDSTVLDQGVAGGLVTTNWTHLVSTYDGAHWNLYVNGVSVGTFADTVGAVNFKDPWAIADGSASGNTRFFGGNVSAAAIYDHALTPSQVAAHYNIGSSGTTNVPPAVSVPSTQITVDQDGNGSISSSILNGPPPFTYQWYSLDGGVTTKIAGATNSALALTDIQIAQGSDQYYVVVSNAFGAVTSSFATLNILSGSPTVVTDVFPLLTEVPAGLPVTFAVAVTGTEPFTYQWSNDGGAIAGATDASYTFNALAGTNSYAVLISNSFGITPSSTALVVGLTNPPPVLTFGDNGTNWSLNEGNVLTPTITSNVLTLTDGNGSESTTAFFDTPQYIGGFIASYVYQPSGAPARADGVTFCIQNAPGGVAATGAGGGDLGYYGISNSAAFEINIFIYANGGSGVQFGANGSTPDSGNPTAPYFTPGLVNVNSGDPINVEIYYNQGVETVWLTDPVTVDTFSTNFVADLPAVIGAGSAYVGFTGGDGGSSSTQTVSNFLFSYTTPPILTVARGGFGTVVVTWPVSVATMFVLQQSSVLNGTWSNVNVAPVLVNSQNQVTLSPGASTVFYRLSLE
jgi:hypothetical protein